MLDDFLATGAAGGWDAADAGRAALAAGFGGALGAAVLDAATVEGGAGFGGGVTDGGVADGGCTVRLGLRSGGGGGLDGGTATPGGLPNFVSNERLFGSRDDRFGPACDGGGGGGCLPSFTWDGLSLAGYCIVAAGFGGGGGGSVARLGS